MLLRKVLADIRKKFSFCFMLNSNCKQSSSFSAALQFPYRIHIFVQSTGVILVFTLEGHLCILRV